MSDRERKQIRHLLVIKDRRGKRAIPLMLDTYSLGRSDDNSIVLYGSSVSRQHATIMPIADSNNKLAPFQIIDGNFQGIKSTNGLTVNETKCDRHHLEHGDRIKIGNGVKVTYYTLFNLSNEEFAQFCETQNNSEVIKQSILNSQAIISPTKNVTHVERSTLIRLASFTELIPHPIIEIDLDGFITYANQTALKQFPKLEELNQAHPIIEGLTNLINEQPQTHFIRELKINTRFFTQSIQYLAEDNVIRILMFDITEIKEEFAIKEHGDRLLREIIVGNNLDFETKIESFLKINCDFFNADIALIGKLQQNSLRIAKLYQNIKSNYILETNQILPISDLAEERSLRLLDYTVNSVEPVTLKKFESIDRHDFLHWDRSVQIEHLPITNYQGIQLIVGKKVYGVLAFLNSTRKVNECSPQKIDFLNLIAQWLVREIEKQQMELVLKNFLKQKRYYQQIVTEVREPLAELDEIAQNDIFSLDSSQHHLEQLIDDHGEEIHSIFEDLQSE